MKKRRVSLLGVAFVTLILSVLAFLLRLTIHRPPKVVLPQTEGVQGGGDVIRDEGRNAIRRVEVKPETVQRVIERLERPANYSRTITIERFWTGGGAKTTAAVFVADGWTRVDLSEEGGETRHVITGNGQSWVWYGFGERVFHGAAAFTPDEEQSVPTYEDILRISTDAIAAADYQAFDATNCIYVETAPDAAGYVERYWVSVDSGLLVAAERMADDMLVYRMTGIEILIDSTDAQAFRLPDGELLFRPEDEENMENDD